MENRNYVEFEILGIKHCGFQNTFVFSQDAVCEIINDQFIEKIVVAADISKATFYLNSSLKITDELLSQIVEYLHSYLGSMMISLIKNSSRYPSVLLKPTIRLSATQFVENGKINVCLNDNIVIRDSLVMNIILDDGNNILEKWVQDTELLDYTNKKDKYDILFLLLQGENKVQKYMAMYAYLMSLVRELYSKPHEGQKQVVQYVRDNCSRVGITLVTSQSTRPGTKSTDEEDQFTALRNKIGHPSVKNGYIDVSEVDVNGLASIICCAIEDIPS